LPDRKPVRYGAAGSVDAVTREIIRGKLLATADEMGIVIARTSMSPVIYEVLDFACGVCDPDGELIVQTNGITLFTGTFAPQVQSIKGKYRGKMFPGDIYMTNDPFEGGTHSADIALIKPVFVGDELLGFAISVAHWSEVGGKVAGSLSPDATEIYQEGIRFPGIRICHRGELQEDIVQLIAENVRLPKMSLGDLNAGLAAVRIADTRLREICAKYGIGPVRETFHHIVSASEQLSRAAVAALPDGLYEAEDWIDGDGITDERIPVQVAVTIEGERMTFDFTGSSSQRPGPINCARGALLSAVKTVFKALVEPQAPSNEGWFRPVRVVIPDGTVFSAIKPAPTGWYYEGSAHVSELVWKALAPLAPERFGVGSYMSLCASYICGKDPKTSETFVHIEPHVGGWGAGPHRDGTSALIATTDGDTYNYSIELLEAKFPLLVHRYALNVQDGAGAGRHRGGFGAVREYEILTDDAFTYASIGRSIERPWGLDGGRRGTVNYMEIAHEGTRRRSARVPNTALRHGARVTIVTGGGGGYGDPLTRPPAMVAADVADDYITKEIAREIYAVVIGADGQVDEGATAVLRRPR
jgi:N-methylhydantoinase B